MNARHPGDRVLFLCREIENLIKPDILRFLQEHTTPLHYRQAMHMAVHIASRRLLGSIPNPLIATQLRLMALPYGVKNRQKSTHFSGEHREKHRE